MSTSLPTEVNGLPTSPEVRSEKTMPTSPAAPLLEQLFPQKRGRPDLLSLLLVVVLFFSGGAVGRFWATPAELGDVAAELRKERADRRAADEAIHAGLEKIAKALDVEIPPLPKEPARE